MLTEGRKRALTNFRESPDIGYPVDRIERRKMLGKELYLSCYSAVKRAFDIVAASAGLVLAAVPMALISLIISADSKGCAIFRQQRVGLDGKLFCIYKFRTMTVSAPHEVATGRLRDPHRYITRAGSFLRRTSLDELPQLFNVLRGDMSLVGPRPLIAGEYEVHRLRKENDVYSVRPGITGWAQVNGRDDVSVEEKVRLDAEYVERRSLLFDLMILFKTVGVVSTKDGYNEGSREE